MPTHGNEVRGSATSMPVANSSRGYGVGRRIDQMTELPRDCLAASHIEGGRSPQRARSVFRGWIYSSPSTTALC